MRKRNRPAPEDLIIPDDIAEAQQIRAATRADLAALRRKAPALERLANVIIDRQGRNGYIELLYQHAPRGAA